MISFGVVVGSFLIGGDASIIAILFGVAVVLACGLGVGSVNAVLIRGFKIPSLIATLATLSILDGISLTLRPTAQGIISDDLVSFLRTSIGPIPIAFIVIVAGAGLLDLWLHASGSGLDVRAVGFDERSAKRGGIRTNWIRVRALLLSGLLAATAALFVMARSPIGNAQIGTLVRPQQHHRRRAGWRGAVRGARDVHRRHGGLGAAGADHHRAAVPRPVAHHGSMITGVLVLVGIVLFQVGDLKELGQAQLPPGPTPGSGSQRRRECRPPRPSTRRGRLLGGSDRPHVDPQRDRAQPRSPGRRFQRRRRADRSAIASSRWVAASRSTTPR